MDDLEQQLASVEEKLASVVLGGSAGLQFAEATQFLLDSMGLQEAPTEINIVGTDKQVSTECILKEMEFARASQSITKLELEDLITRTTDKDVVRLTAHSLIWNNKGNRKWREIRFFDCIRVAAHDIDTHGLSRAMFFLCGYEAELFEFWDLIKEGGCHKLERTPLVFQVNVTIDQGATLDDLITFLRLVRNGSAGQLEFGGALAGFAALLIPHKLAGLFRPNDKGWTPQPGAESDMGHLITGKKIELDLMYFPTDQSMQDKNYTKILLNQCLQQLNDLKTPSNGSQHVQDRLSVSLRPNRSGRHQVQDRLSVSLRSSRSGRHQVNRASSHHSDQGDRRESRSDRRRNSRRSRSGSEPRKSRSSAVPKLGRTRSRSITIVTTASRTTDARRTSTKDRRSRSPRRATEVARPRSPRRFTEAAPPTYGKSFPSELSDHGAEINRSSNGSAAYAIASRGRSSTLERTHNGSLGPESEEEPKPRTERTRSRSLQYPTNLRSMSTNEEELAGPPIHRTRSKSLQNALSNARKKVSSVLSSERGRRSRRPCKNTDSDGVGWVRNNGLKASSDHVVRGRFSSKGSRTRSLCKRNSDGIGWVRNNGLKASSDHSVKRRGIRPTKSYDARERNQRSDHGEHGPNHPRRGTFSHAERKLSLHTKTVLEDFDLMSAGQGPVAA